MQTFKQFLEEESGLSLSALADLRPAAGRGQPLISGLNLSAQAMTVALQYLRRPSLCMVVVPEERSVRSWVDDLSTLVGDDAVLAFPSLEQRAYERREIFAQVREQRLEVFRRLSGEDPLILVCSQLSLRERFPEASSLFGSPLLLKKGATGREGFAEPEVLREELFSLGFSEESMVENIGDFAVRGGVVDIYPFLHENPVRIDLFGEEIESIREFDIFTQRSLRELQKVVVHPQAEAHLSVAALEDGIFRLAESYGNAERSADEILGAENERLLERGDRSGFHWQRAWFQKLPNLLPDLARGEMNVFWEDDGRLRERFSNEDEENEELYRSALENRFYASAPAELMASTDEVEGFLRKSRGICFSRLSVESAMGQAENTFRLVEQKRCSGSGISGLEDELCVLKEKGVRTWLLSSTEGQAARLVALVKDMSVQGILVGHLSSGFVLEDSGVAFLTDHQIFNRFSRKQRRPRLKGGVVIPSFEALSRGDIVIHQDHGVGRYRGICSVTTAQGRVDCILLEYEGKDRLSLPVADLNKIERYGGGDENPRLGKLGGKTWKGLKERTHKKVVRIAKELVALYAARQVQEGFAFPPDAQVQQEFEDVFEYEPTPDQLRASEDCKRDMEKPLPMDRLVCGDVGFGKTEVAMRVAFKAVTARKQVALLAPTTILAAQHYESLLQRFSSWPVHIELLNRYRSKKEKEEVFRRLEKGTVDIVVGTHAILSARTIFRDLGLFIIDEEQKFGVKQKEKLREVRMTVDTLCMSATPIPRTLQLSMAGARDISLITTPPRNRLAVDTRVLREDPKVLAAALESELSRGGQAFVVSDRVAGIEDLAAKIEGWVPEARIAVAHGQMNDRDLEQVMAAFLGGEFDILVCTTIIESGIDVPTANTLIVFNAYNYGASQLYQLRGRVGRSGVQARAYLVLPKDRELSDDAEKRLRALEMYTDLGSGYKVAMRDLEIRGAGNLLGTEQSGFIAEIGYETYLRMVREAVDELQGGKKANFRTRELRMELTVDTYLPEDYVEDGMLKIGIYQKIARIERPDEVRVLREELADRFGPVPEAADSLLQASMCRVCASLLGIQALEIEGSLLILTFPSHRRPRDETGRGLLAASKSIRFLADEPVQAVLDLESKSPVERLTEAAGILFKAQNSSLLN